MKPIQIHPEVCCSSEFYPSGKAFDFLSPPPDIDKPPFEVTETGYVRGLS